MFQCHRIVAVIPAGRRRYLEILLPQLTRHPLIDSIQLWANTLDTDDIAYMRALTDPKITVRELTVPFEGNYSISSFFPACTESGTIYIRFDDDVLWLEAGAIADLARYRIDNPAPFLVYGNIINNAVCSHIHERMGAFSLADGRHCGYDCMDSVGWNDGRVAEAIHTAFLADLARHDVTAWQFREWRLWAYERVSINVLCWFGSDFAQFGGQVGRDEEEWLSVVKPRELGRPNAICGSALCAHFGFNTQRAYLEANTGLLAKYAALTGISTSGGT